MEPARHPQWLVAPTVTFAAVIALLIVARVYDRLPLHPPDCGFRTVSRIPCAGCGGTRSMKALASGDLVEAVKFSPAAVLGVLASMVWLVAGIVRFRRGQAPLSDLEQNRRILRGLAVTGVILLGNWIYLIFHLPR